LAYPVRVNYGNFLGKKTYIRRVLTRYTEITF
jgi:hypothetical protein